MTAKSRKATTNRPRLRRAPRLRAPVPARPETRPIHAQALHLAARPLAPSHPQPPSRQTRRIVLPVPHPALANATPRHHGMLRRVRSKNLTQSIRRIKTTHQNLTIPSLMHLDTTLLRLTSTMGNMCMQTPQVRRIRNLRATRHTCTNMVMLIPTRLANRLLRGSVTRRVRTAHDRAGSSIVCASDRGKARSVKNGESNDFVFGCQI